MLFQICSSLQIIVRVEKPTHERSDLYYMKYLENVHLVK